MAGIDRLGVRRRGQGAAAAMTAKRRATVVVLVAAVILGLAPRRGRLGAPNERDTEGGPSPTTLSAGFVLDGGRYRTLEVPGSLAATEPTGINDRGEIVGYYGDANLTQQAFRRDRHGRYTSIRVPGAAITAALRINDRGQIVGAYGDSLDPADATTTTPRHEPPTAGVVGQAG